MSLKRILVVEDEGIVSLDIQNRLRQAGYTLAGTAASGEEAIAQALSSQPDLILMDIKLQGQLDGIEAARQIRARLNVPIVYLTAYADEDTLKRATETAVFGYLLKPFKERELIATIEMALSQHRLERQLRESEQWFGTMLSSISEAVIATDKLGHVRFINPVAELLTGWPQTKAVGIAAKQVFHVIDADDRALNPCPVKTVLETGEQFSLQENALLLTESGSEIFVEYSAAPIIIDPAEIAGVVLVFRDVTERKKAMELLLQVHKMESLGVLAGGVAHDFNNLLVAILGQVSLAQAKLPETSIIMPHLAKAKQAAEQAAELTRQLLAYSGRGQFRRQPLSLTEHIWQNQQLLAASIPKEIKIEFDLNDGLPLIDADPLQMQQVIMNLALNAAEAIGDQAGIVRLHTGTQTIHKAQVDNCSSTGAPLPPGDYVLLEVADTGCGIPPELMTQVFEPFFTTKPSGRGLGLSAVLGAVRGHQGCIMVENQLPAGTALRLLFPVSQHEPSPVMAASAAVTGEGTETPLVLVIDDELYVREAIADTLELEGIDTLTAADGHAGITLYRDNVAEIGLILLDLSMPAMDGAQVFQRLLEINPQARIVLMSGYDKQDVMHKQDWQGLAEFMAKPFETDDLLETVRQYLHQEGGA